MTLAVDEGYDPFEEFNRAMGAGVVQNPYPAFVGMRARGPIVPTDVRQLLGLAPDAELPEMGDGPPLLTVNGFDAVQEVLRDGQRFSSKGYEAVMGAVFGHSILEMDEPEHREYRSLIQQAFTRKEMDRWEADLVSTVVDDRIDSFVADGRAELVTQFFLPFPVTVVATILGLPPEDSDRFNRLAVELISVSFDMDRAMAASAKLYDYFCAIIEQRRAEPQRDMISVLAKASHEGHTLTDDEICAFLRLLAPAGAETTFRSSSNLLFGLLTHPEQFAAVRADRALLPQAIEEGLRWEPPLLTILRTATEATTVCGVDVPAGANLIVNIGSANHDESRWTDAESFDILRPLHPHMAFAFGPHMCLGVHLARMETRVAMNRLFDRLPDLRLDPDAEAPYITGMTFRAPVALPVVWG